MALAALIVAFGSRHLLTRSIPAIGEFQPIGTNGRSLVNDWWSGWHPTGGGVNAAAPTGQLFTGLFWPGAVRKFLAIAPLFVGPLGVWRLLRPFGSKAAAVVAAVFYAATPIAYDALAAGSVSALVVYATAPWIAASLAASLGVAPFESNPKPMLVSSMLTLGLLVGVAAALTPIVVALVVLIAAGLALGSLLAGDERGLGSLGLRVAVGLFVAAALNGPWFWSILQGGTWAPFGAAGTTAGGPHTFAELLRLAAGPFGGGPLGYVYLLPGIFALLIAQEWRFSWALRGWFVALSAWLVQWAGERGWLPVALPHPDVLLAIAALGLTLAAACGVAAFEQDMRRYTLGWRQLVPFATAGALVLSVLPLAGATVDGRWGMPRQGLDSTFGFLDETDGGSRQVAWIGQRDVMPVAGATFDEDPADKSTGDNDLVLAFTEDRGPRFVDRWSPPQSPIAARTAQALRAAAAGDTVRLGSDLAPLGVRYLVLPEYRTPIDRSPAEHFPLPPNLLRTLDAQLDLERIESINDAIRVYVNTAWVPVQVEAADPVASTGRRVALIANVLLWVGAAGGAIVLRDRRRRIAAARPLPQAGEA